MSPRQRRLPPALPRSEKSEAGRTGPAQTPLELRLVGVGRVRDLESYVRARAARKLGKFAFHVERVTIRFKDENGPRGGVDTTCQVKALLSSAPTVVVEHQAAEPREAFDSAIDAAERALKRTLGKRGWSAGRTGEPEPMAGEGRREARGAALPPPPDGSLIGGRVGNAEANLLRAAARPEKERGDIPVDTAEPGRSATDRRAGGGSTAARNTRLNDAAATSSLEDSAQDRPSRKSTRRSNNRVKRDGPQRITEVEHNRSPQVQATRNQARRR